MGDVNEERTQVRSVIKRGGVSIQYPMLNDTNYGLWTVKMKIIMKALGVWEEVEHY
jgi:starvation-inducible outer membrane lipoprotein